MRDVGFQRWTFAAVMAAAVLLAAPAAHAVGTAAGTPITNQATVAFEDVNGNPLSAVSNIVTTTVAAVNGVDISPAAASQNADPGEDSCFFHTVTNTGNEPDIIDFQTSSTQGWTVVVYEDDGDATFDAGDTALVDNNANSDVDTNTLAADGTMDVFVCVTVPTGTANGTVDVTTVDVFSGIDPSETDSATDTTTVDAPSLSVVKSVSPTGDQPPGTVLTYTIVITNNGGGDAQNVVMTDPVPTNTTYQGNSITLNAAAQTDPSDSPTDESDHNVTTAGAVTVGVGTVAGGGGSATVTFLVQID